jgi:hypothetical protein
LRGRSAAVRNAGVAGGKQRSQGVGFLRLPATLLDRSISASAAADKMDYTATTLLWRKTGMTRLGKEL